MLIAWRLLLDERWKLVSTFFSGLRPYLAQTPVGPVHAASVPPYMLQSCWVRGICVHLWWPPSPLTFTFCLPLHRVPETEKREIMETSHLGIIVPRSLTLGTMSVCLSLCLFPSAARGSFSDDVWARHWTMRAFRIITLLYFLSRTVVFGFTLGPWAV